MGAVTLAPKRSRAPRATRPAVTAPCLLIVAAATAGDVVTRTDLTFGGVEVLAVACAALLLSTRGTVAVTATAWLGQAIGVGLGAIPVGACLLAMASTAATALLLKAVAGAQPHLLARPHAVATAAATDQATPQDAAGEEPAKVDVGALRARGLTARECDVVALALWGFTADQIGRHLFIGRRTVETHLARAYSKFGVHSRAEMAEELFAATAHRRFPAGDPW